MNVQIAKYLKMTLAHCLGVLFSVSASIACAEPANPTPCNTLLVTGNPEYPPFLWRDKEHPEKLIGAAVDLLNMAVKDLGIAVDSRYVGPWARSQEEAKVGRVDMLTGAFITDQRQTYMDYIKPAMMDMSNVIFVKKGAEFPLNDWSDLKGRQGDTLINNSFGQAFDTFAKNELIIEQVRSIEFAFERLLLGRTDYVIYEEYQGYAIAEARGFADKISHLPKAISAEGLYFTLSKASRCNTPEFLDFLNKKIAGYVQDGVPAKLAADAMIVWRQQSTNIDGD